LTSLLHNNSGENQWTKTTVLIVLLFHDYSSSTIAASSACVALSSLSRSIYCGASEYDDKSLRYIPRIGPIYKGLMESDIIILLREYRARRIKKIFLFDLLARGMVPRETVGFEACGLRTPGWPFQDCKGYEMGNIIVWKVLAVLKLCK